MAAKSGATAASSRFPISVSAHCALIALVLALAIFRFFLTDGSDRHHCTSLLTEGRWLDSEHKSWQPEGCMLHAYSPPDVTKCFDGRHILFVGDSTVRQVFYAAVQHVDKNVDTTGEKHSDKVVRVGSMKFSFHWDPFLNSSQTLNFLSGSSQEEDDVGRVPTLAVFGSGMHYLRYPASGGLDAWKEKINDLFNAVAPGGPLLADEIVFLPIENVVEAHLSEERQETLHLADTKSMNVHLTQKMMGIPATSRPNIAIPTVFNRLIEGLEDETEDGLHYSGNIVKSQAAILLNLRCNDFLPKTFPFDKTCCSRYPTPNWVQIVLLLIFLGWAPTGIYLNARKDVSPSTLAYFPAEKYLLPMSIFGFAVSFLFIADRTSLFLKENKQYDALTFAILCLATVVAGVLTLKPAADKDLGFLNREQTDEWKGWMQIAILIYHYLGASKISGIYNPIRVLVAAYLFMSGYGHLSFFLKKADYGFSRVANILVRINLLTVVLAYLMDTDYLSYYFSPLVTLWFIIIWVTMWAGNKYNDRTPFLIAKLCIGAALTAVFFELDGGLDALFSVLNTIFATTWNAKEWRFRVTLDMWIVWGGMFTALAFIKIKEARITDRPEWPQWQKWTIVGSGLTIVGYMVFELTRRDKFVYNGWHPYISILPVLAFCVLRNATPYLRSTSSKFFIFFGQCSLETFIIQFHLFIAADTKGIIMMIPGGKFLRPVNFIITSLVFVFVSHQTALATGSLTEWICSKPTSSLPKSVTPRLPPTETSEYVPLSTLGETEDGKGVEGESQPTVDHSLLARVAEFVKADLRIKFLLIVVGLWVMNHVYPKSS